MYICINDIHYSITNVLAKHFVLTNANFKLHWSIIRRDHGGIKECCIQFVGSSLLVGLHRP